MPEDLENDIILVKIAKFLNGKMATSYYNPETLKMLSAEEIDNAILATTILDMSD